MVVYENDCCGCATEGYPCTGLHKKVKHLRCDDCDEDLNFAYIGEDGGEYCEECILDHLEIVKYEDC